MTDGVHTQGMPAWQRAALAILPVVAASLIGQWATYPNLAPWYAELVKPSFNPPNWVFAPVWTALYALMALAVWRVLRSDAAWAQKRAALALFFCQLVLNALWSVLFFGLRSPLAGLIEIVPQWILIVMTIVRFWRLDSIAALCLSPLGLWVAFAALLNFEIWRLNG
jgi:benzodiazapine receptor